MAFSISTRSAAFDTIVRSRGRILNDAKAALYVHGTQVRSELNDIARIDSRVRSRHAAAFAILSPQCPFDDNVRAVRTLLAVLENNDVTVEDIVYTLRGNGYRMLSTKKAASFLMSSDVVTQGNLGLYTFDTLRERRGFGPKTTSMALALYSEYNRVMTLDTWMLAGLLGLRGSATTYTATKAAYVAIADMLLQIADELSVSPFMLQWCMWCYYRNNTFESHIAIFE